MSGTNESNAMIIDSDEEQEVMVIQEITQKLDATSSSASGHRVGNEATTSSTNTKNCVAECTGTVSSVLANCCRNFSVVVNNSQ